MEKITLKELAEINACDPAIDDFIARYGEDGEVGLEQLHQDMTNENKMDYIVWLAGNCCPHTRALIDAGADVNIKDKDGSTALMWASDNGHTETVKLLIDAGADVNIKNKYGRTALMWASRCNRKETVKLLIDAGADVNAKDEDGWTALIWASRCGHAETVKLLIDAGAGDSQ